MIIENLPYFNVEFPLLNEEEMKEKAKLVVAILRPEWHSDISFIIFSSGITNKVLCAIGSSRNDMQNEEKILFRIFGKNSEKIIDRVEELNNWKRLAINDCAAQIYAKFVNGIIYGFLNGKQLTVETIRIPHISEKICEMVAKMHRIDMDEGSKSKVIFFRKIQFYLKSIPDKTADIEKQEEVSRFIEVNRICIKDDVEKLRKMIEKLNTRVVFCHNDLLIHNILYDEVKNKVHFIDYEYAGFNYQGFDIANHFCEYAGVENVDYSLCPNAEYKKKWIIRYLQYFLRRNPSNAEIKEMIENNVLFEAAAHFFWTLWALVQSQNSLIDFDYLNYALLRYGMFRLTMKELNSNKEILSSDSE